MLNNPLVSIIVPIYNVEQWLDRCLHSIQIQTWSDIEVWLVNDGSQDNSLEICKKYASEDRRFHIINQANGGVSKARNAALKEASGAYLQFVDSDDYLPPDATVSLVKAVKTTGADLAIGHFYRVSDGKQVSRGHIKEQKVLTRLDFAEMMMKAPANYYYGVLWNKLYRRSIIDANNLRFETSLNWCEDFLFNLEYIKYAQIFAAVPTCVYYYVKREDSLVNTQSSIRNTIRAKRITFAYYKDLYQKLDLFDKRKMKIYSYFLSTALDGTSIDIPEMPDFLKEYKDKAKLLKKNPTDT